MSNPTNKYTKDEFIEKVHTSNVGIELLINEYTGVDSKYKIKCKHGENDVYGWQLVKGRKHCCKQGYHENRTPALKKTLNDRIDEIIERWGEKYIVSNAMFDPNDRRKIIVECRLHGEFSQWTRSLVGNDVVNEACPECSKIAKAELARENAYKNFQPYWGNSCSVSKAETEWLDTLGITERQYFIEEICYTVDGYDKNTNTVYLYHGRFWHGCPETFDPNEQHPILKVKMKDLYEKTMFYEQTIKDAGYNLITKWGT